MNDINITIENWGKLPKEVEVKYTKYYHTIADLLKNSVFWLLSHEEITLYDIAVLKQTLNIDGYHLEQEEAVDYTDYSNEKIKKMLDKCDELISYYHKLVRDGYIYQQEQVSLEINNLYDEIEIIRELEKSKNDSGESLHKIG